VLRRKHIEDFKSFAFGVQTIFFWFKVDESIFQADALKNIQIIAYAGSLPHFLAGLKAWLVAQLNVPENKVVEDILAMR
jgi:hypothetical protein